MKNYISNEKGVTLVALIVTIIILLILASIALPEGKSVIENSKMSTFTAELQAMQEEVNQMNQKLNNGDESVLDTGRDLVCLKDSYSTKKEKELGEKQLTALDKGAYITNKEDMKDYKYYDSTTIENLGLANFNHEFLVNIKTRSVVSLDGMKYKGSTYYTLEQVPDSYYNVNGTETSELKIGDYVAYSPVSTQESFVVTSSYSGYDQDQQISKEDLNWRVLNIDKTNNIVTLVSEKPTNTKVWLQGAQGYNNGVYLLNKLCTVLYGNANNDKTTASSLNIEDIQDHLQDKTIYTNYTTKGLHIKYGEKHAYATKQYPLRWKNDNGTEKESTVNGDIIVNPTTGEEANTLEVTQTGWEASSSDIKGKFLTAHTSVNDADSNIYYELLCNNGADNYWLASRYVDANRTEFADFGIRSVTEGTVGGQIMFNSAGTGSKYGYGIRPVVSIPLDSVDITTGSGLSAGTAFKVK